MAIWSQKTSKTLLDPTKIKVNIPLITNETWKRITDIWLPLHLSGSLSMKTLLSKIPSIDVKEEMEGLDFESTNVVNKIIDEEKEEIEENGE